MNRSTDRRLGRFGPMMAYLVLAATLAYGLHLQRLGIAETHRLAARSACDALEHRIGSRLSARSILETLQALARASGTPALIGQARVIQLPPIPEADLVEERNRVCMDAGVIPDDDPRLEGD